MRVDDDGVLSGVTKNRHKKVRGREGGVIIACALWMRDVVPKSQRRLLLGDRDTRSTLCVR